MSKFNYTPSGQYKPAYAPQTQTIKRGPGLGKKFSRGEGFWRIFNTMKDVQDERANILDVIDFVEQKLVFRTIEAGPGVKIEILDADNFNPNETPYHKIRIGLDGAVAGGITIQTDGTDVTTTPATTMNFLGNVSAVETSPGNVDLVIDLDVLDDGVVQNTSPVKTINFTGAGVTVTETTSGNLDVQISNLGTFSVQENGATIGGTDFTTFNFVGVSGAVADAGGGVAEINLASIAGFNDIIHEATFFTGVPVSSGSHTITNFFSGYSPNGDDVIVSINGLTLEWDPVSANSDFEISGSDLVILVDNLGYPLDSDDKISGYFWTTT